MATRRVSNTLSRWHKVLDRVKSSTHLLAEQIAHDIRPLSYNNAAVFRAEQLGVERHARMALDSQPLLFQLNAAQCHIREALAKANVDKGISALLAKQVSKQHEKDLLEGLIRAAGNTLLPLAEAERVLGLSGNKDSTYRETHTFARVSEAQAQHWRDQVAAINRELVALSDQLSDLNASRVSIDLEDALLDHLGM